MGMTGRRGCRGCGPRDIGDPPCAFCMGAIFGPACSSKYCPICPYCRVQAMLTLQPTHARAFLLAQHADAVTALADGTSFAQCWQSASRCARSATVHRSCMTNSSPKNHTRVCSAGPWQCKYARGRPFEVCTGMTPCPRLWCRRCVNGAAGSAKCKTRVFRTAPYDDLHVWRAVLFSNGAGASINCCSMEGTASPLRTVFFTFPPPHNLGGSPVSLDTAGGRLQIRSRGWD
jgi:hypothetical protein